MYVDNLKISKTYSEKQVELISVFHYKAGKETGLSDEDTFIRMELHHEKPFGASEKELHENKAPLMFDNREFWTDERLQYVTPISEEEYLRFQEEKKQQKLLSSKIREHTLKVANSSVLNYFYSTAISKRLNLPLKEVERELELMVEDKCIQKKYQLICHECLRQLDIQKAKEDFELEYACNFCGEEIEEDDRYIQTIYTGINK